MEEAERRNQTPIVEFILLGFGEAPELQPLLFLVFLLIYLVTVAGNLLIIVLVVADQHLHTPMYYFVGNLAGVETCFSSTTLPRLLASLLGGDRTVSVKGCIVQLYFFAILANTECLLLAAMSYDRYVAICHPLHYATLMNGRVCGQIVAGSWISSILTCIIVNALMWQLTFCGSKEIDHFFCDFFPAIQLSCSDTRTLELVTFAVSGVATLAPLLLTLASYVCIFTTILQIPSTIGRQKAFSTCSTHLILLAVFYGAVIAIYVVPTANTPKILHKIFSLCYTVLPPLINPMVYCLRNKEVNESMRIAILRSMMFRNRHKMWTGKS